MICAFCGVSFKGRPNQRFCSDKCRFDHWSLAHRPQLDKSTCIYCGMPSQSKDHVPPVSIRKALRDIEYFKEIKYVTVPSCLECNSLLGSRALWTIYHRRRFIHKAIYKKYRKYLDVPDWDKSEIEELGPGLRRYVEQSLVIRAVTRDRLAWSATSFSD